MFWSKWKDGLYKCFVCFIYFRTKRLANLQSGSSCKDSPSFVYSIQGTNRVECRFLSKVQCHVPSPLRSFGRSNSFVQSLRSLFFRRSQVSCFTSSPLQKVSLLRSLKVSQETHTSTHEYFRSYTLNYFRTYTPLIDSRRFLNSLS